MSRLQEPLTLQDYNLLFGMPQVEVFGGPNFFPDHLIDPLIALCEDNKVRKTLYAWMYPLGQSAGVPKPIADAVAWAETLHQPANRAILKRYSLDDPEPSGAYDMHPDPEIYHCHRIALISLSGQAELTVQTSSGETVTIDCERGTALFVDPKLLHAITPPLNEDGMRHFLFLGFERSPEPQD